MASSMPIDDSAVKVSPAPANAGAPSPAAPAAPLPAASAAPPPATREAPRDVFFFGDGTAEGTKDMKAVLGGKGANLAEMTNLGVPVPPGFTIATSLCVAYPLLVSVRSGAPVSMPGMMETILNLGLNDRTVHGLAKASGNARFAYDSYRRFIQMYGDVVLGVPFAQFEHLLSAKRLTKGAKTDADLDET